MSRSFERRDVLFFAACCLAYIISAIYLNCYGADAPVMMAHYGISSEQQGLLVTLQSCGGAAGAILLALKGDSFDKVHAIELGLLLFVVGCSLMGMGPSYGIFALLAIVCGLGFTLIDVMVNGVLSDAYPERKNTLISLGHAFYGGGAMVAPLLVALLASPERPQSFAFPFLLCGIVSLAFLIFLIFSARGVSDLLAATRPAAQWASRQRSGSSGTPSVFQSKTSWILLIAGTLYFSFQMGSSAWLSTFCVSVGLPFDTASYVMSGFFAGALVMGFACAVILRRMRAKQVFGIFGILSAACMACALFSTSAPVLMTLVVLSGFLQGGGVITLILVLTDAFPAQTASASAIQVVSADIGAITAPLWIGSMAETTGYRVPLLIACVLYVAGSILVLTFAPGAKKADAVPKPRVR